MSKPGALFVAVAMAVTAACVGVIAKFGLDLSIGAGVLVGLCALTLMATTHLAFLRAPEPDHGRLDDLDRVVTDLQSRIETLELRLSTVDGAAADRARAAVRPVVEEIAQFGTLVTSIAKEVASHDAKLMRLSGAIERLEEAPPPAPLVAVAPSPSPPERAVAAAFTPATWAQARLDPPEPFDPAEPDEAARQAIRAGVAGIGMSARLELALKEDRIDIHLQPIVELPSRRRVHFEAFSRLVETDGVTPPSAFLPTAIAEGLSAEIDRRAIERAAATAARLAQRGLGAAVFVNLAPETLTDRRGFGAISALFDRDPAIARLIVIELAQGSFAALDEIARGALQGLAARGVRLSIDKAADLRLEPRDLARQGVRFLKVEAARLLDPESARGAAIHPADLSSLFARQGVELIATHVEEERTVPELLDMDVKIAQGELFGVARPVKPTAPDPRGGVDLDHARPAAIGARR